MAQNFDGPFGMLSEEDCPMCQKIIQKNDITCKHCGYDLEDWWKMLEKDDD